MTNRPVSIDFLVTTETNFVITTRSIEELRETQPNPLQGTSVLDRFEAVYTYQHEDPSLYAREIAELEQGRFPPDILEATIKLVHKGAQGLADYMVTVTSGPEPGTERLSIHGTVYGTK